MKKETLIAILVLLLSAPLAAQEQDSFCGPVGTEDCNAIAADSNIIISWATGCTLERGPQNIAITGSPIVTFGKDSAAMGASSGVATDAVSLGDGGSATVTFAHPIRNGEGPDFAVFENGIVNNVTGNAFLELAFVEVSSDGVRFVRFPATSNTPTDVQVGTFGEVDPTMINNLAGKFEIGYGTPFDLEELRDSTGIDIDSIVYVRIVDVVGCIDPQYATYDAFGNIVNDPWPTNFNSSGFDLTGVAVMYERTDTSNLGIGMCDNIAMKLYPNPTNGTVCVIADSDADAMLTDMAGHCVMAINLREGRNILNLSTLSNGIYILRTAGHVEKIIKR